MNLSRIAPALILSLSIVAFGCGGDDDESEPSLQCGEGTIVQDGECVADQTPSTVTCGEGTSLFQDECLADESMPPFECGPGTILTGDRCESDTECGPGTTRNMLGECVPDSDISCGENTIEDGDECVVDPATVIRCAGSTVLVESECLSRSEALALTPPVESIEPDDPKYGGTETPFTLPSVGEFVVLSGVIEEPEDLNSDGQLNQDEDYFLFTGEAGDVVEIELVNDGLAEPFVSLKYKDEDTREWSKTLPENVTISPGRYFVLPQDGEYQLVVTHAALHRQLVPRPILGSPDYKYFVVIEHAPALSGGDETLPTTLSGDWPMHIDSAVTLPSTGGANFALASATFDGEAYNGEINAYDDDGLFSATRLEDYPLGFAIKDGATLVPEWRQTAIGDESFSIDVEPLPNESFPSSKADQSLEPGQLNFYAVEPPDNSLLEVTVTLDNFPSDLQPVIVLVDFDLANVTQVFTTSEQTLTFRHFVETSAPYMIVIADAQSSGAGDYGYSIDFDARPVNVIASLDSSNPSGSGTTGSLDGAAGDTALVAFENASSGAGLLLADLTPDTATEAVEAQAWIADADGIVSERPSVSANAGETASASLSVDADTHAIFEVSLTTGGTSDVDVDASLTEAIQVSDAPGIDIPDDGPAITQTLSVTQACTIADITIDIDINHTWIGDLLLDIVAPDNTTVRLRNGTGSGPLQLVGTYPTTLTPHEALTPLIGLEGMGTWQLVAEDTFNGDQGTLNSWGITLICQ